MGNALAILINKITSVKFSELNKSKILYFDHFLLKTEFSFKLHQIRNYLYLIYIFIIKI